MPDSATLTRYRDRNGEISKKHGNTLIRTLRKTYGANFAKGCNDDETLSDVLHKLDEPSLSSLIRDHETGRLEQVCRDWRTYPSSFKALITVLQPMNRIIYLVAFTIIGSVAFIFVTLTALSLFVFHWRTAAHRGLHVVI
jgi:hypothetical protein